MLISGEMIIGPQISQYTQKSKFKPQRHLRNLRANFNYTFIRSTSSLIILDNSFFRALTSCMFSKYIMRLSL